MEEAVVAEVKVKQFAAFAGELLVKVPFHPIPVPVLDNYLHFEHLNGRKK